MLPEPLHMISPTCTYCKDPLPEQFYVVERHDDFWRYMLGRETDVSDVFCSTVCVHIWSGEGGAEKGAP